MYLTGFILSNLNKNYLNQTINIGLTLLKLGISLKFLIYTFQGTAILAHFHDLVEPEKLIHFDFTNI